MSHFLTQFNVIASSTMNITILVLASMFPVVIAFVLVFVRRAFKEYQREQRRADREAELAAMPLTVSVAKDPEPEPEPQEDFGFPAQEQDEDETEDAFGFTPHQTAPQQKAPPTSSGSGFFSTSAPPAATSPMPAAPSGKFDVDDDDDPWGDEPEPQEQVYDEEVSAFDEIPTDQAYSDDFDEDEDDFVAQEEPVIDFDTVDTPGRRGRSDGSAFALAALAEGDEEEPEEEYEEQPSAQPQQQTAPMQAHVQHIGGSNQGMMRYFVEGVSVENGTDMQIIVEATNPDMAKRIGEAHNMWVKNVSLLQTQPGAQSNTAAPPPMGQPGFNTGMASNPGIGMQEPPITGPGIIQPPQQPPVPPQNTPNPNTDWSPWDE